MRSENRIWESKFLGELETGSPIFPNKNNNEMQFKIKIISSGPSDFPNETVKIVTGFSEGLRRYGYLDQVDDDEIARREKVINILKDKYIVFSVRETEHSNPAIMRKYFNATDLMLLARNNEENTSQTFETIPLFSIEKGNISLFTDKIMNEEYLGRNESISYHKDDLPPFILIHESKNTLLGKESDKLYALGPFLELQHNNEYGIKFLIDEPPKLIEFKKEELAEYYVTQDGVAFVTTDDCLEIERKLHKALKIEGRFSKTNESKEVRKIEDIDEEKFLARFEDTCKSKGLVYELQDLYNFHTAMKTQGFVILAGMSGTGKSQLVQCYFEALTQRNSEDNLLFIPVSPSWQDDSDLLGYLDTLNSVYRPGDSGLVDFVIESTKRPNECFIVCLDEMNLARVEHYFSQFLSVLERDIEKRSISLYNSKIEDRIFNRSDYPSKLTVGENLLLVGTVNTDESTFSFSDKVLDRANVINLTLMNFMEIKQELETYESMKKSEKDTKEFEDASINTFTKFQGMKKHEKKNKLKGRELEFLWRLHSKLNKVNPNIGIGMRILNQMEEYLINLPESIVLSRNVAFDLQISQRIFTKLRGSEGQLFELVGKESEDKLIDGEIINLFEEYKDISSFDFSIQRLRLISRELAEYGHTI